MGARLKQIVVGKSARQSEKVKKSRFSHLELEKSLNRIDTPFFTQIFGLSPRFLRSFQQKLTSSRGNPKEKGKSNYSDQTWYNL